MERATKLRWTEREWWNVQNPKRLAMNSVALLADLDDDMANPTPGGGRQPREPTHGRAQATRTASGPQTRCSGCGTDVLGRWYSAWRPIFRIRRRTRFRLTAKPSRRSQDGAGSGCEADQVASHRRCGLTAMSCMRLRMPIKRLMSITNSGNAPSRRHRHISPMNRQMSRLNLCTVQKMMMRSGKTTNGQKRTKRNGGKPRRTPRNWSFCQTGEYDNCTKQSMSGVACRKEMVYRRVWGRAKMRMAGGEVAMEQFVLRSRWATSHTLGTVRA